MGETVFTLFDEYAARFARGERPDPRDYVARAGARADELAELIDGFLARTVPPQPDEEARDLARAWVGGEPPLVALRVRRGLRRSAVVDALVQRLGLDPQKREKVRAYYHRLESGLLDPAGVDQSVFGVLIELLGFRALELVRWRIPPQEELAYMRLPTDAVLAQEAAQPAAEPAEPDEIDRLFIGANRDS
jgi:hypothetical protein